MQAELSRSGRAVSWGEMASVSAPAASTQPALPSGPVVFKTVPYAFILPEIVSMPNFAAYSPQ